VLDRLVVYVVLDVVLGGLGVMMCPERLNNIHRPLQILSYLGLRETDYNHEYVNHSEGERHINRASILRPWLSIHRGICKNNPTLYPAALKTCRKFRKMKPIQTMRWFQNI